MQIHYSKKTYVRLREASTRTGLTVPVYLEKAINAYVEEHGADYGRGTHGGGFVTVQHKIATGLAKQIMWMARDALVDRTLRNQFRKDGIE